jgi:hypothetical protein
MSFIHVLAMTAAELFGNAHLKWFADNGKHHHLGLGILAWVLVIGLLIAVSKAFQHDVDVHHVGSYDCYRWGDNCFYIFW